MPLRAPLTRSVTSAATPAGSGQDGQAIHSPPSVPTQEGPDGIRFDFNDGCRVMLPQGDGDWRVLLRDAATANPLFETQISPASRREQQEILCAIRDRSLVRKARQCSAIVST